MQDVRSSETLVSKHSTTWRQNPEDIDVKKSLSLQTKLISHVFMHYSLTQAHGHSALSTRLVPKYSWVDWLNNEII
jgi:hypothetical protein